MRRYEINLPEFEARRKETARKTAMYRRRRVALTAVLGGVCACQGCGAHSGPCEAVEDLEFDHPHGRTWVASKVARWTRIKLYEEDHREGNLRLLCGPCNRRYVPDLSDTPF